MSGGLSRAEAAKYLGFQSVEGIRHLQKSGKLAGARDKNGHFRFEVEALDRLKSERHEQGLPGRLTKRELARHRDSADSDQEFEVWLAERARKREKVMSR